MLPPTRTTSSISSAFHPESSKAICTGSNNLSSKSCDNDSNIFLSKVSSICNGPSLLVVINGKDIFVFCNPDNSHLAFSAASVNLCNACLSLLRSISCLARNFSASQSTIFESKLFPPSCVSPQVALTSNTPLEIFNNETSNVPPPKSKTKTLLEELFSKP